MKTNTSFARTAAVLLAGIMMMAGATANADVLDRIAAAAEATPAPLRVPVSVTWEVDSLYGVSMASSSSSSGPRARRPPAGTAAWGGFVLPFTDHAWGFSDAGIDTMTIDPHKMGQAAST
jgi:hypothetical protein